MRVIRKNNLLVVFTACLLACMIGSVLAADLPTDFAFNELPVGVTPFARWTVCEGVTNRMVPGQFASNQTLLSRGNASWLSADGTLRCEVLAIHQSQSVVYRLIVSTTDKTNLKLLRVKIAIPVDISDASHFWDGYEERPWLPTINQLDRTYQRYTFPVNCVYGQQQGLTLGITPDTIVSTLHPGITRNGEKTELFYETRIVVDADHPQTVSFVAYSFRPTFGAMDAVQDYYNLFPQAFEPAKNVDQRIFGVGGYHVSSYRTGRLAMNSIRRSLVNWEWSYAPWVRSGDWYPEKKDWVQGTDVIRQYENYRDDKKGTWEEYHEARTAQFIQGNKSSAMFYYLLVKDINVEFLKRYPGSQLVMKGGTPSHGGMGALLGDDTGLCSPYGSGLSDWLQEKIRKVVENYEVSGFAFDMANYTIDDYGQGQRKCGVGRAFDDKGDVYSPDTISAVLFADYIHTLSRDGKRMGVVMNQAISQSSVFPVLHGDAVMYESLPDRNPENVMPLRLMSGRKPMTFWGALENGRCNTGIRWANMTDPKAERDIREGLAMHALLTCLRIGATPMNWAVQDIGKVWMPTLIQLKQLGWNPVPAVISSNPDLWIGRFGSGEKTIITISNPKRQRITANLVVLNCYLGSAACAFVSDQGQTLLQNVTSEKTTFAVDLAPKEIMVLRVEAAKGHPDNAPRLLTGKEEIISFFTEQDALTNPLRIAIVIPEHTAPTMQACAEIVESYYANLQAYRERPNDLEPGFMNTRWNTLVKIPMGPQAGKGTDISKCITLGMVSQFPELMTQLDNNTREKLCDSKGGFLLIMTGNSRPLLWIGGTTDQEVQSACEYYLQLLDSKYIKK